MSKEKTFDELFEIAKARGFSDAEAIHIANDIQLSKQLYDIFTEDAEFEIIQPKQIENDNQLKQ